MQECENYSVSIVSINPKNDCYSESYPYETIGINIESRVIKSKFFFIFRVIEGIFKLYYTAKKLNADIYIAITVEDLLVAYTITRFSKAKLVYNANELEGDRKLFRTKFLQSLINKIIRSIESYILKSTDSVIAADIERGKVMEKWYGIKEVEIIRNVPIYQDNITTNLIRETLSINNETKVLLYQGAMGLGRGLEQSILACANVNNQQFILVLLGDINNNYKNTLLNLANDNGFVQRLCFIPAVPWQDLLFWTAGADISLVLIENISLSYYLAAPNKLYESIMANTPYIASNFPEINHVHTIAKAGVLVNPENIDEITSAIESFFDDDTLISRCKANASIAKEIFNWDIEKIKLISIIDNL